MSFVGFYEDETDAELLKLLPFLENLAAPSLRDVRPSIRDEFKVHELVDRFRLPQEEEEEEGEGEVKMEVEEGSDIKITRIAGEEERRKR